MSPLTESQQDLLDHMVLYLGGGRVTRTDREERAGFRSSWVEIRGVWRNYDGGWCPTCEHEHISFRDEVMFRARWRDGRLTSVTATSAPVRSLAGLKQAIKAAAS